MPVTKKNIKGKVPKEKKQMGAPSTKFCQEMADRICQLLSTNPIGYETLNQIYPELPCKQVVNKWRIENSDFASRYFQAKTHQAQILVEEIDSMLPEKLNTFVDEKGNERYDPSSASMMIAKLNNRKWTASRLLPKIYGDAKQVETLTSQNDALREELRLLREQLNSKNEKDY